MANLGVSVAVMQDGKVLLTQREDFEFWALPGGGVERGETLAQAARREVLEETGLEVRLTRLVGIYFRQVSPPWGGHGVLFAAEVVGGCLRAAPDEVRQQCFFALDELPKDIMPWLPGRLRDVFAGAGGSVVWRLDRTWSFPPEVQRLEAYRLRDQSGLSRAEFYHQFMGHPGTQGDVLEAPGPAGDGAVGDLPIEISPEPLRPPILAANVVVIEDGKVLLMQREDFEVWGLPGGQVDEGESMAQAAQREVLEEVGLEVKLTRLVGIYSDPRLYHCGIHGVLFAGHVVGGALRIQRSEGLQARFFAPDELPVDIQFGMRRRIEDAFNGVGGSVACRQEMGWPFPPGLGRRALYALRDQSGLERAEFFRQALGKVGPLVEVREVG